MKREKNASDGGVAPGSRLDLTVQEWTETKREGRWREGERGREGRESPECKAMFSRNVLPPVLSCNLTGNSPESCLTETQGGTEGGREGERKRRWIW